MFCKRAWIESALLKSGWVCSRSIEENRIWVAQAGRVLVLSGRIHEFEVELDLKHALALQTGRVIENQPWVASGWVARGEPGQIKLDWAQPEQNPPNLI